MLRCLPFAHVVALESRETVCDGCMRVASETIYQKCSGCKAVYYCTVDCQRNAWVNYHRKECKCLRKVSPKIPTDTVRLMARIIFKLQEGELKTFATLPDGTKRYLEDLMTHPDVGLKINLETCLLVLLCDQIDNVHKCTLHNRQV